LAGDKFQRQLKLGEMISMLKELESNGQRFEIASDQNVSPLKN